MRNEQEQKFQLSVLKLAADYDYELKCPPI